jgi:SAM-dependent methyltransferase
MGEPDQGETIGTLWNAYRDAPLSQRLLASARTLICPFERIARRVPAGSRTLDIGCGTGALLNLLAARELISEGIGCDINQAALTAGRQAAKRRDDPHADQFARTEPIHESNADQQRPALQDRTCRHKGSRERLRSQARRPGFKGDARPPPEDAAADGQHGGERQLPCPGNALAAAQAAG